MIPLTLAEVAAATGGRLADGAEAVAVVRGAAVDSRQVDAETLFVALAGSRVDGHDFAAAAVAAGAPAVLAARPVGVPAVLVADPHAALAALAAHVRDLAPATVVAVTGSAGKTTTKDLLADLLAELGPTVAAPGSFNNEIGLPLTLLRTAPDTAFVVLEMGARGRGHIATLCGRARPSIGAVLNVGSAHVGEYPDGRLGIAAAKGELAEAVSDTVVLNADDPLVAAMAARAGDGVRVITFGVAETADVRAEGVRVDRSGRASFDLLADGERQPVTLGLVGAHQVPNALAAAAVALRLGLAPARIAAALAAARPRSRWRMEVVPTRAGVVVVNDAYNANPESMRAALTALVDMRGPGRAIAVLGGMGELGDAADEAHDALGRLAVDLGVDLVVAVGPAARAVHLAASREGSRDGGSQWVADIDEAVAVVVAHARPDDVVLVKASRADGLERVAEDVVAKFGVVGAGIEGT
ncbi:UDP-N-acetylmuramoyl-tripeptide--D-alanyl-D-alanine ligase [Frankia sp. AgB32]|uniref:UDP-N-acetylmuramoyl-tripeptide--D-alanyl-D- alanine ligase n=1 Tax=Frankia sp. AgB32 TaxID=631119 RepID=UPI00200EA9A3|nr:UDP-N-acetylmuramoyl-tripeptide--D-alanyl-D-alanine ligase [Frankia sp. AgB32]MCK9893859.1 UDP-N-acetylmuramoyl-tripeptide--D-alanyl-D-alanine ligase [Frankia sp. AgB32]